MITQPTQSSLDSIQTILEQNNFWRFFVDGDQQKATNPNSKYGALSWHARESSGLEKMKETAKWLFTPEHINTPLSVEFIQKVHASAFPISDHLFVSPELLVQRNKEGSYKTFGSCPDNSVNFLQARAKKLHKAVQFRDEDVLPWTIEQNQYGQQVVAKWSYEQVEQALPVLIANYHRNLKDTTLPDKAKINLILELAQDLEDIHQFKDGNCRIFITLLLNKELVANGFAPALFENPNDFDFLTKNGKLEAITSAQEAYAHFCETGYPYEDCVRDEVIAQNVMDKHSINPEFTPNLEANSIHYLHHYVITSIMPLAFDRCLPEVQNAKNKTDFARVSRLLTQMDKEMCKLLPAVSYNTTEVNINHFIAFYEHNTKQELKSATLSAVQREFSKYCVEIKKLAEFNLNHYGEQLQQALDSSTALIETLHAADVVAQGDNVVHAEGDSAQSSSSSSDDVDLIAVALEDASI